MAGRQTPVTPLRVFSDVSEFGESKSGRVLQTIRRSMDLIDDLMRRRLRNEQVLALSYQDTHTARSRIGGSDEWENMRENALNLPYRYVRWVESQATSKKMIVKVDRDAGASQRPGGPADTQTAMWLGITLGRVAYEAGFQRETKALIAEVLPRGTSVIAIGYHEEVISPETSEESGKDAQSVVVDVLGEGDFEAKDGQDHEAISEGLANMAKGEEFQATAGTRGVNALLARKDSHDDAAFDAETDRSPIAGARVIRRRAWMRKKRVGEDVGWAP